MSEAGEHRRALRGGAARLQERRAMAVLGREARRRNQRSEVVMARRQLSPPPAPRQLPAVVPTTAAAAQSDAKRMKLERWKQRKLAQKQMKKDQKLCQPPFRAGVRTPAFSIYDMNAPGRIWGPTAPRRGRSATASSATQVVAARGRRAAAVAPAVAAAPPTVRRAAGGRMRRPAAPASRRVTRAALRAGDMAASAALAVEDEVRTPAEEDAGGDVGPTSRGQVHSLAPPDFHSFRPPAGLQAFSFPSPRHYANSEGRVTAQPIECSEPVAVELATVVDEHATVTDELPTVTDEPTTVTGEPAIVTDEPAIITDEPERPTAVVDSEDIVMEQPDSLSVVYFRGLLRAEMDRLCSAADAWDDARAAAGATVELRGDVLSVQGQVRLLVRERFAQFEKLVDQCEHGTGELPTTLNDLQGFWEMIYFQVEDVDQKLARLAELKRNGWKEVSTLATAVVSSRGNPAAADRGGRKRPLKPAATAGAKQTASAGLRSMMAAARKRLASSVQDRAADVAVAATPPPSADDKRFSAGFFEVQSPAVSQDAIKASIQRCREADLRRSVHLLSAQKRLEQQSPASFSPLLARVSASAKQLSLSSVSSPALSCRTAAVAGAVLGPLVGVNTPDSARIHKRGGSSRRRSSRPLAQLMAGSPFPAAAAVRQEPGLLTSAGDELGGVVAPSSPANANLMVLGTPTRRSTRLQTIRTLERK